MAILTTRWAIFNNWNFNNVPGLSVYALDLPGQAKRTLNIFELARRNARKLSSAYYKQNTLQINVYITAASREALEAALDTLYQNIQDEEGTLIVPKSGSARQYTATYSDTAINNSMSNTNSPVGNVADLTLIFECSDSYGYDTTAKTFYNLTNQTNYLNTYPFIIGGTAKTQVPVIQVQLNTTPGSPTNASIIIGNQTTGQAVTVTRTWSQYDLLVVDSKNKTVQVNGVDVVFSGAIPEFSLGSQTLYIQDTFTSRNYRAILQLQQRYN